MSIRINLYPLGVKDLSDRHVTARTRLCPSGDYRFIGYIIDLSFRRDTEKDIPDKAIETFTNSGLKLEGIESDCSVISDPETFYFAKAEEFGKIPVSKVESNWDKNILSFLKKLPGETLVMIEVR